MKQLRESLICPISQEIIQIPFFLSCGHVYEKQSIKKNFKQTQECPLCKCVSDPPKKLHIYEGLFIITNQLIMEKELQFQNIKDFFEKQIKQFTQFKQQQEMQVKEKIKQIQELFSKQLNESISELKLQDYPLEDYEYQFLNSDYSQCRRVSSIRKYEDGSFYEGQLVNDLKDGIGKLTQINGDKYEGGFKQDMKDGDGIIYYSNGDVYKGGFIKDKKSGEGEIVYFNRNKYIGEWKEDRREGKGEMIYYSGDRFFIIFLIDIREIL